MSSEKNAPPSVTPEVAVPRPDTTTRTATRPAAGEGSASTNGHAAASSNGHGAVGTSAPPPPPPPPPGDASAGDRSTDEGMETASGESRVSVARAGAVKAAAAALAAARSAAKKVSASAPAEQQGRAEHDVDQGESRMATTADTGAGPDTSTMHYSAAGVTGTASSLTGAGTAASTATGATPAVRGDGPRRVRLSVSRIDPWSAMKLGFLLAVAIGIMTVVATAVVWYVLDGMMVFQKIQDFVTQIAGEESNVDIMQFVEFGRVVSLATLLGVINVVIITALSTILAFLYNIVAALVGGVHLTLTDD
ncbi:DUF3566 domain-containing protein [Cellulosimicrobium cellulans]|uniref:DUF3566 domain-containing protein n=1 Tax=Cellulosimicrobium cellulans TaxID=1710 RepID=UPI000A9F09F5|nr:DUF3566 domain-containing protein [Cellulosimicrobium cellulans]